MNELLKELKDVRSKCCVTLLMKTHRTRPENEKDQIRLRSLLQDLEKRLHADYEVRFARKVMEKMKKVAESIDHNHNQEGLVLFANEENIATYARVPFPLENRIVVDPSFATRPLVRASHQEAGYYALVLSREKARLIEAYNDQVSREVANEFPMDNETLYSTNKHKLSTARGTDRLIEEFFNRVDKAVMKVVNRHPMPLVIATEKRNYYYYRKVADKREVIIGHLNKNRMDETAEQLVSDSWPVVQAYNEKKNKDRLAELKQAVNSGQFISDFNDIWMAIRMGRGRTLFVQEGLFQPAKITAEDRLELVDEDQTTDKGVIDDIIDDMIEENLRYGGDTVFLSGEELDDFQGLALVTRY
jgi:hypothetical protein